MILFPAIFLLAGQGHPLYVATLIEPPRLESRPASPDTLSLSNAIGIAEERAFSVRIAQSNLEKARQKLSEGRGLLGPKLTLDATYTRFDKAIISDFGGGNSVVTRPIDSKDARFNFSIPIDLTGRALNGPTLNLAISQAQYDAVKNDIAQAVKRAYFQVLQAESQLNVQEESLVRAKERLAVTEAEFRQGARAKVDVLRFETAVKQAENDVIQGQNALSVANSAFNNTLGRPIETAFELAPASFWEPVELTDDDLVAMSSKSRPELRAADAQIKLLEWLRKVEERAQLPTLNVSVQHSRSFGQLGFGASSGSTIGVVALNVPLWDSGVIRTRVKAARQDEEIGKLQRSQLVLGISLEVRQARAALANSNSRLIVAKKAVELAKETYRLQALRFKAGEGIALEVSDASTELTRAETNLVSAEYDYLRAIADLERAIGAPLTPKT